MIPIPRRSATRAGAVAALCGGLLAVTLALGGCTPGTDPKPTPTPLFTSEADAYKAAEKVYREYTAAGAARNAGDPQAQPEQYLAGAALEEEIAARRQLDEQKLGISGEIVVTSFKGTEFDRGTSRVMAGVCLDVSGARILDQAKQDVTPKDRPQVMALSVTFDRSKQKLVITKSSSSDSTCSPVAP